jgi:hypothetical protein
MRARIRAFAEMTTPNLGEGIDMLSPGSRA